MHKLVGGNLLDVTYETYFAHNLIKLNTGIEIFGICLYGESTIIRRKPFLDGIIHNYYMDKLVAVNNLLITY
jgi:hypothetical protein